MNNNLVDIIIVNWNSGDQLSYCIDSVCLQHDITIGRCIVVDNHSTDGSEAFLEHAENILLIKSGHNRGFGAACNLGGRHSTSDYLLFLNPDAAVFPGTVERALAYMQDPGNADVGICGVQLVDEGGHVSRTCARFPTVIGFLAHATGLDKYFPSLGQSMAEWPHDNIREVDQVMGAFFLVRRALFNLLGGFDERFFVYYEEVDFSYRAHLAGWRSVYLADAQAFHAGGGTSNQIKARRLFYSLRSRLLYAAKHFNKVNFALVLLATLLIEPLSRSALSLARRSWLSLKETWQGYTMLWRWLLQWLLNGVTR
jgi:GT2 family glycosyltransferase